MIHLIIPDSIRRRATAISKPLAAKYASNSTSIRGGAGHYYAKIGEIMVSEYYDWKHVDTYDNDVYASRTNLRVEVKVKQRTVKPRAHYLASVAAYNTKQDCDNYLFCSVVGDRELYIIGWYPKPSFISDATFYRRGDPDPQSPPGQDWRFRADCYNIPYARLNQLGNEVLP